MRLPVKYIGNSDYWHRGYLLGFSTQDNDAVAIIEDETGYISMYSLEVCIKGDSVLRIMVEDEIQTP
jgi:hypothetical protein